jgi:thiol-disulfide isomerase/thioredoxin
MTASTRTLAMVGLFTVALIALAVAGSSDAPAGKRGGVPGTLKEKASYAIGRSLGGQILAQESDFDVKMILRGIEDVVEKRPSPVPADQLTAAVQTYRKQLRTQPAGAVVGHPAPRWGVTEWTNLPEGTKKLDVDDFAGKVVVLFCFQSWCPGCHSRGFPTLKALVKRFAGDDDVAFVAVQTVFEGFAQNTAEKAWATAKKYKLDIPFGHSGTAKARPAIMKSYRTRGTPWMIVIDREGKVRFSDFHIQTDQAIGLIDKLKKEEAS